MFLARGQKESNQNDLRFGFRRDTRVTSLRRLDQAQLV